MRVVNQLYIINNIVCNSIYIVIVRCIYSHKVLYTFYDIYSFCVCPTTQNSPSEFGESTLRKLLYTFFMTFTRSVLVPQHKYSPSECGESALRKILYTSDDIYSFCVCPTTQNSPSKFGELTLRNLHYVRHFILV